VRYGRGLSLVLGRFHGLLGVAGEGGWLRIVRGKWGFRGRPLLRGREVVRRVYEKSGRWAYLLRRGIRGRRYVGLPGRLRNERTVFVRRL
jgi:hypothetical protein